MEISRDVVGVLLSHPMMIVSTNRRTMKIDCCAISDVNVNDKLQHVIASDCVSFATLVVTDFRLDHASCAVILYEFFPDFYA